MIHKFRLRVIETSWGVAIDLKAHLEDGATTRDFRSTIRFEDESLPRMFRYYAVEGVDAVLRAYPENIHKLAGKMLVIDSIEYVPTDFQEEGIACAVSGWLCRELGIDANPLGLVFDPMQDKYVLKTMI